MIKSPMTPICVPMGWGGRYLGPKFGPKHRDTRHDQAVLDIIAGWRKAYKNLHGMTKGYRSKRTPSYFKTGAVKQPPPGSIAAQAFKKRLRPKLVACLTSRTHDIPRARGIIRTMGGEGGGH